MKLSATRFDAFIESDYNRPLNASSPRSLILTISLLWFNVRIPRYSRASR